MNRLGLLLAFGAGMFTALPAQDAPPPPPQDRRPQPDLQPHQQGQRQPFPGIFPRREGAENGEMFRQLPEAEKARVRAAFEKAWNRSDVNVARDNLNKANEEFRKILHNALQEADPEVVKIMEKIKQPMGGPGGGPMFSRMPDPNEPEFGKRAIGHLAAEMQSFAKREGREGEGLRTHERVLQAPAVRDAVKRVMDASDPQKKGEAWRQLREAYFGALRQEGGNRPREPRNGAEGQRPGDAPKPPDDAKK